MLNLLLHILFNTGKNKRCKCHFKCLCQGLSYVFRKIKFFRHKTQKRESRGNKKKLGHLDKERAIKGLVACKVL